MDLTPLQEYHLSEARRLLELAKTLANSNRLARGQEVLRSSLEAYTNLPRGFTDQEFEQKYKQTHSFLYRGF